MKLLEKYAKLRNIYINEDILLQYVVQNESSCMVKVNVKADIK